MNQLPHRILSIDVLRAITMLLMIFVNDVAGVSHIPEWIKHTDAKVDGMGFSDLIFPAFLFIVGLSLPFALENRRKKGDSTWQLIGYIALRSVALVVMGFFHVNLENYDHASAFLPYPVYTLLVTLAFFLIWLDYATDMIKVKKYSLIISGIVLLITLAFLYKGGSVEKPQGLQPHWWGILGIIGWAYLVSALVFLLCRSSLLALLLAFIVFGGINLTTHLGVLHIPIPVVGDASSITLMLAGALISGLYKKMSSAHKSSDFWFLTAFYGLLAFCFGMFIRPYAGGISKIYATPAWVMVCLGISILVFELLIYVVDVKGKKDWFKWIKPAGTSTLTCYLIPYLLYALMGIVHFHYPHFLNFGIGGIIRSF